MVLEKSDNNDEPKRKGLRELTTLLRQSDPNALQEIVTLTQDRLFAYTLSRVADRDSALDLVQETFVDLWIGRAHFEYQSDHTFWGFLFRILKRKLARHYEKETRTEPLDETRHDTWYELEPEDHRFLLRALGTLSVEDQELLTLRYWAEFTFGEIAAILEINESAAKVRHHRALKKMRVVLKNATLNGHEN